jgi:hypothetical protein
MNTTNSTNKKKGETAARTNELTRLGTQGSANQSTHTITAENIQ